MRNKDTFTIADSLDPALSNHIVTVSVHTLNIPRLITAKDFSQTKQIFTEYCLKYTWGGIVCMQPISACYFSFLKSQKIWWTMADTIRHTSTPMKS